MGWKFEHEATLLTNHHHHHIWGPCLFVSFASLLSFFGCYYLFLANNNNNNNNVPLTAASRGRSNSTRVRECFLGMFWCFFLLLLQWRLSFDHNARILYAFQKRKEPYRTAQQYVLVIQDKVWLPIVKTPTKNLTRFWKYNCWIVYYLCS